MDSRKNEISYYRPGNLVRKANTATIAWPGDLCVPENLTRITPLGVDDLVLKHFGFTCLESSVSGNQTYKRRVSWQKDIQEDERQMEFFVLFRNFRIFIGLQYPANHDEAQQLIEVQFAHEIQNYYADVTGLDELNILLVDRN